MTRGACANAVAGPFSTCQDSGPCLYSRLEKFPQESSPAVSDARRRILVIDDDPRLLHIVAMYLGIEGYDVATASNGEDGLREVDNQTPDLVICDIMMPGMDGVETCRRIRTNPETAHIPVLMFSALSGDDDVERARLAGANHLITKPFNLVGLGSVVKSFFSSSDNPVAV